MVPITISSHPRHKGLATRGWLHEGRGGAGYEETAFREGEHIFPLVETVLDDIWSLPQGDSFSRPWILVLPGIKSEDEVTFVKGARVNMLVEVGFGSFLECLVTLECGATIFI